MNTQELLVHDCRQRQRTERLHAGFINGLGILVLAFQLEGEIVGQVATLVVSTQEPESLGIVNLQRPQVKNTLDTEVTTINVITQKEVSRLGGVATNFKQLHQVVVLSVNVTADGNRCIHLEKVGLGTEELGSFLQDPKSLLFGEATFAVEVSFEKLHIGLLAGIVLEELFIGRLEHGRRLYV